MPDTYIIRCPRCAKERVTIVYSGSPKGKSRQCFHCHKFFTMASKKGLCNNISRKL